MPAPHWTNFIPRPRRSGRPFPINRGCGRRLELAMIEQLSPLETESNVDQDPVITDGGSATSTVTFDVESVTGSRTITATFQKNLETGAAARAIANELGLGNAVPWMLRRPSSSAFLDEKIAVG